MSIKKQYTASEKVKIALEAIKAELSFAQISSKYEVHSTQISNWRKQALDAIDSAFSEKNAKKQIDQSELINELYQQIGKLSTECEWLKKKSELFKH